MNTNNIESIFLKLCYNSYITNSSVYNIIYCIYILYTYNFLMGESVVEKKSICIKIYAFYFIVLIIVQNNKVIIVYRNV